MANTTTVVEIGYAPDVVRDFTTTTGTKLVKEISLANGEVRTYRITAQANEQGTANPGGGSAMTIVTVRHSASSTAAIVGTPAVIFTSFTFSGGAIVLATSAAKLQVSVSNADGGNYDWVLMFEQLLTSSV